jgi:hypothetical protein
MLAASTRKRTADFADAGLHLRNSLYSVLSLVGHAPKVRGDVIGTEGCRGQGLVHRKHAGHGDANAVRQ